MTVVVTRPRLGFLGVGWIGSKRLDAVRGSGLAQVVAVADPAVSGALGSLDELLESDLDGIVIATPSALHAEQALAALERGIAVFCQKPLALDAVSARQVVDAARAADRPLAVDFCYRTTEAARRVREVVAAGELGEIFAADLVFHNAYGPDKAWFRDPALSGGGCVIDLGIHLADLGLWTLGFPEIESLESALHGAPLERYAAVQARLAGGTTLRLSCSWWLPAGRDCVLEASFYGEHGGASLHDVGGSFYDFAAERFDGTRARTVAAPPDDWGGRAILDWTRRVAAGEGFDPAAEENVRVHELLDRIYGRAP